MSLLSRLELPVGEDEDVLSGKTLPPEIWAKVFEQLRQPTPLPRSRPPRSALTQPHLAILLRVCRPWKTLAEPLLYKHVTTDNFVELAESAMSISHTPFTRFALTQSFRIEYTPKGEDASYMRLLCACSGQSPWADVGMSQARKNKLALAQCGDEVAGLTKLFGVLNRWKMANVFLKLHAIAVDSVYARESDIWKRYMDSLAKAPMGTYHVQRCTSLFSDFLNSGNLRSVCARDGNGPLGIEHLTFVVGGGPGGYPTKYTKTLHFSSRADVLALPCSSHINWVADASPTEDLAGVLNALGRCAQDLWYCRKGTTMSYTQMGQDMSKDPASVDIYCSTSQYSSAIYADSLVENCVNPFPVPKVRQDFSSRPLSVEQQKAVARTLEAKIQKLFRGHSGKADKFRWHISQDTPVCASCSSGPPV